MKTVFLVHTNPVEGLEEEYNDWYTNRHLQDVLKIPGFTAAQRWVLSETPSDPPCPPPAHKYLAIYDVEGTGADAIAALAETVAAGMEISEALAPDALTYLYEPITGKVTSVNQFVV